ncbi:MAG: hypothetical protein Q7U75_02050, partial [Desulfobacterales bacterium]|nr:hypothetical protein [Desulfobacterales bacterium]
MFGFGKKSELERAAVAAERSGSSGVTRSVDLLIEQGAATAADLMMAPAITIDREVIELHNDGEMCTVLAITHWPARIGIGWFRRLIQLDGKLDISLQIHPVRQADIEDYLRRSMEKITSSMDAEIKRGKDPKVILSLQQQDIEVMQQAILHDRQQFFQATLLLCVYGKDEADLRQRVTTVRNQIREVSLDSKILALQQRQGLAAVLPLGLDNELRAYQNFYTSALATGFPFVTGNVRQEKGIWYGLN